MANEERVRNLAYKIWESEGRPEGQQQRHWDMALRIVVAEEEEGIDVDLDEVGEPVEEPPLLEDDLPLEDDETGIQENRLPLDSPNGEPDFDELPYRDVARDEPVQDRASPGPMEPLPPESATAKRTRKPRRAADGLTQPDATDTSQVPGKTAGSGGKRMAKAGSTTKSKASAGISKSGKGTGRGGRTKT